MNFAVLIPFQLFCILLFSKTFIRANANEVKIIVHWRHLPGIEDLEKFLFDWTERFEIRLFRLSYEEDPYFGKAIGPPIASGKTGPYDFGTLIVPTQQIGTQNVIGKGKELAESSGKGKEKDNMDKKDKKDLFELQIEIISPTANLNIQQTITKRLNKLPGKYGIIICSFHTNMGCSNEDNRFEMERPNRNILFELQDRPNLNIKKIVCTKTGVVFFQPKRSTRIVYGGEGQVCPSDEYTIYFKGVLEDNKEILAPIPSKCDEAFYISPEINIYQLWHDNGICKLKLINKEKIEKGKNIQGIQIMDTSSSQAQPQRKKLEKSASSSSMLPSPHVLNLAAQWFLRHRQPLPTRPIISSEFLREATQSAVRLAQKIDEVQSNLQHSPTAAGTSSPAVLRKSATMPRDQHSGLRNVHPSDFSLNLPGQSSNPEHGSSVGISEGQLPTNSQPSQIVGTFAGQLQRQHLPQHSVLQTNVPHESSSNKRHGNVQQIQPSQPSEMPPPLAPIQFENLSQHPLIDLEFNLSPPGGSSNKQTKQLLDSFGQQPLSSPNLQMNEEQEEKSDEQPKLELGLRGKKRMQNKKDGKGNDEKGSSKRAKKD